MASLPVQSGVDIEETVGVIEMYWSEVWLFVAYVMIPSDMDI